MNDFNPIPLNNLSQVITNVSKHTENPMGKLLYKLFGIAVLQKPGLDPELTKRVRSSLLAHAKQLNENFKKDETSDPKLTEELWKFKIIHEQAEKAGLITLWEDRKIRGEIKKAEKALTEVLSRPQTSLPPEIRKQLDKALSDEEKKQLQEITSKNHPDDNEIKTLIDLMNKAQGACRVLESYKKAIKRLDPKLEELLEVKSNELTQIIQSVKSKLSTCLATTEFSEEILTNITDNDLLRELFDGAFSVVSNQFSDDLNKVCFSDYSYFLSKFKVEIDLPDEQLIHMLKAFCFLFERVGDYAKMKKEIENSSNKDGAQPSIEEIMKKLGLKGDSIKDFKDIFEKSGFSLDLDQFKSRSNIILDYLVSKHVDINIAKNSFVAKFKKFIKISENEMNLNYLIGEFKKLSNEEVKNQLRSQYVDFFEKKLLLHILDSEDKATTTSVSLIKDIELFINKHIDLMEGSDIFEIKMRLMHVVKSVYLHKIVSGQKISDSKNLPELINLRRILHDDLMIENPTTKEAKELAIMRERLLCEVSQILLEKLPKYSTEINPSIQYSVDLERNEANQPKIQALRGITDLDAAEFYLQEDNSYILWRKDQALIFSYKQNGHIKHLYPKLTQTTDRRGKNSESNTIELNSYQVVMKSLAGKDETKELNEVIEARELKPSDQTKTKKATSQLLLDCRADLGLDPEASDSLSESEIGSSKELNQIRRKAQTQFLRLQFDYYRENISDYNSLNDQIARDLKTWNEVQSKRDPKDPSDQLFMEEFLAEHASAMKDEPLDNIKSAIDSFPPENSYWLKMLKFEKEIEGIQDPKEWVKIGSFKDHEGKPMQLSEFSQRLKLRTVDFKSKNEKIKKRREALAIQFLNKYKAGVEALKAEVSSLVGEQEDYPKLLIDAQKVIADAESLLISGLKDSPFAQSDGAKNLRESVADLNTAFIKKDQDPKLNPDLKSITEFTQTFNSQKNSHSAFDMIIQAHELRQRTYSPFAREKADELIQQISTYLQNDIEQQLKRLKKNPTSENEILRARVFLDSFALVLQRIQSTDKPSSEIFKALSNSYLKLLSRIMEMSPEMKKLKTIEKDKEKALKISDLSNRVERLQAIQEKLGKIEGTYLPFHGKYDLELSKLRLQADIESSKNQLFLRKLANDQVQRDNYETNLHLQTQSLTSLKQQLTAISQDWLPTELRQSFDRKIGGFQKQIRNIDRLLEMNSALKELKNGEIEQLSPEHRFSLAHAIALARYSGSGELNNDATFALLEKCVKLPHLMDMIGWLRNSSDPAAQKKAALLERSLLQAEKSGTEGGLPEVKELHDTTSFQFDSVSGRDSYMNQPFELQSQTGLSSTPGFYDYVEEEGPKHVWVDFANMFLGGGCFGHGFVQEEVIVAEFAKLAELIAANFDKSIKKCKLMTRTPNGKAEQQRVSGGDPNPLLIKEVDRNMSVGIEAYGGKFGPLDEKGLVEKVDECKTAKVDFLAIAAPNLYNDPKNNSAMGLNTLKDLLNTAVAGFQLVARDHQGEEPILIHTGKWGAGVFGNDYRAVLLVQLMAAQYVSQQTGQDVQLKFHGYKENEVAEAMAIWTAIEGQQDLTLLSALEMMQKKLESTPK